MLIQPRLFNLIISKADLDRCGVDISRRRRVRHPDGSRLAGGFVFLSEGVGNIVQVRPSGPSCEPCIYMYEVEGGDNWAEII